MRFPVFARLASAAALSVFAALAPAAAADAARTITVSGTGEVRGAPDQAQLSAGVTTTSATANEALAQRRRAR